MSAPTLVTDVLSAGVRPATAEDAGALTILLATAFHHDAVAEWIFPDPVRRARLLPGFFTELYAISVAAGGAYTTGNLGAVLLTTPPGYEPDGVAERRLIASAGEYGEALEYVARLQYQRRPAVPHHYLQFVAKSPDRSSAGLAAALTRQVTDLADAQGVLSYAEASSGNGRILARRHGFTPVGTPITIADDVTLQPMWRAADAA